MCMEMSQSHEEDIFIVQSEHGSHDNPGPSRYSDHCPIPVGSDSCRSGISIGWQIEASRVECNSPACRCVKTYSNSRLRQYHNTS